MRLGRLVAALVAAWVPLAAQSPYDVALLPGSTRSAGLAGAGVALVGDAASMFANPAGIATIRRLGVEASYERYVGDRQLASGAAALRVGHFDFGVGGQALDAPNGSVAQPTDFLAMSDVVYRFGLLAAGTTLKYARATFGTGQADAWAGDAGLAVALFDIMALGASVQNIGGDFGGGMHLPRITRVGFTMNYVDPQGTARLLTTIEGRWQVGQSAMLAVGAEGGIVARGVGIVARVGASGQPAATEGSAVTVGGGIELGRLHLDYAYRAYRAPGTPRHRFGVRWAP